MHSILVAHLLPVVPLKISCRSAILLIVILFLELSIWAQVQLGVLDIWLSLMAKYIYI